MQNAFRSAFDDSQWKSSADNDERRKPTSTTAKLWITSLNSHFAESYSGTKYSCFSTLQRSWQRTPANRTHFLSWPNHQIGFALGAFEGI